MALHKPHLTCFPTVQWISPSFRGQKQERRERDSKLNRGLAQTIVSAEKKLARAHKPSKCINNSHKIMFGVEFTKHRSQATWSLSPITTVSPA